MHCQTCGDTTSPTFDECRNCHTPLGRPAVTPGLPTYAVRGIGTAVQIAVGATALLFLLVSLFPVVGLMMADRAAADRDGDLLLGAAVVELAFSLPFVLAILTAAVLVIIWTWRARKNIEAFPGALPSLGAGWAIAGWLVPFANLVVPARVVANIARDSLWQRRTPALVGVWWTAWLVFSLGERFVDKRDEREYARLPENPVDAADFQAYVAYYERVLGWHLVPAVACLVAAASLIVLVRRISAAQQARIARATPAWPVTPGMTVTPGGPVPSYPQPAPIPPTPVSPQVPPAAGGTIGA
ncbi:DUF4328 domain-containing protein [Micromonospora coxensis]|uniref:DUF4328 domain-containing protein n=1 Tax=Micromonospora coxensis TaxID=356852 RepID=A0A1C5J7T8_9ACTN|nr:DUF4328 domain-containing protein [Micromonospora coxensis]SCG66664.1 protein of unknown function [Micromonospora coxensis]